MCTADVSPNNVSPVPSDQDICECGIRLFNLSTVRQYSVFATSPRMGQFGPYVIDTSRVVGEAGSMKRSSVRLSVPPIIRPPHAAAAGLLLWARRPGDIDTYRYTHTHLTALFPGLPR